MTLAIGDTLVSIAGSSLTTIAGFFSTMYNATYFRVWYWSCYGKGVFIGVLSTITIFPAFLLVFDKVVFKTKHNPLIPSFNTIKGFVVKHYKLF